MTQKLRVLGFLLRFCCFFAILAWLFEGSSSFEIINRFIPAFTQFQTAVVAWVLKAVGEEVTQAGTNLSGELFTCAIEAGCNGLNALALLFAGILAFPATGRDRVIGLLVLTPAVVLINLLRIGGLYVTGAHFPSLFVVSHLYVGQVLVVLVTAALWWSWLVWTYESKDGLA